MDTTAITTGDSVLISPDLTGLANWTEGVVIEVENNTFNGIVVSAETRDRNVFFGQKDLFQTIVNNTKVCLQ